MSDMTIHERVREAISEDALMFARLSELRTTVQEAKQAEDKLRKESTLLADLAATAKTAEDAVARAEKAKTAALEIAKKPLLAAQAEFARLEGIAIGTHGKAMLDAKATAESTSSALRQASAIAAAEARATVHRAEKAVENYSATMTQHRQQVKENLGIDLSGIAGF